MPKRIHGLKGSCLVIPCSFSYTSYPPKDPHRVVWYQYVSKGYPLVYDPWYPDYVIEKFRWKTDLYGDPSSWDCSLLIKNLEQSHHGEKLYTWIDPENVGKTSPQLPSISIFGGERTGDAITVVCSGFHTCPYSKPTITLNGLEGSDQIKDESIKDGLKTHSGLNRVTYSHITFLGAKDDHGKKLICTANFSGGKVTTSVVLCIQYPVLSGLKTIGLYILTPSLVFLLACILAGVIIYKKQQR
uniref:Uncharacterized protein n=1 Tax=Cyprinus carpio TaxID=7962 RepID=A0A8C1ZHG7_CYPCA